MAQFNISTNQLKVAKQPIQKKYVWLELMNSDYQILDELSGVTISGNISITADSDMRRTCSLSMVVENSSFEVTPGGEIWLERYVRVVIGTEVLYSNEIEKTNCGIYIIDAPSYTYNSSTHTLTLCLLDLMSKLTGIRNGYIKGVPVKFLAGESIRSALIDTLALGGFTKYIISNPPSDIIPNDIELSQGITIYQMLATLRDIYPAYEIYFDVNGIFHYEPIPTGENEPIQIDDVLWDDIVIAENVSVDFQNVKNSVEVYGRIHEPAHYSTTTSVSGTNISLTIADVSQYTDGIIYGFTLTDNQGLTHPNIQINSLASLPLVNQDETLASIKPEQGEIYYCVAYQATSNNFLFLGHLQAYAQVEDDNPDSPFYIGGEIGRIRLVLYDGTYANCFTDALAEQRAQYELRWHTQLQNTVSLTCVNSAPFLDVNALVEYTLHQNKKTYKWLIKSINFGFGVTDNMTITLMRYYPNYFYV